MNESHAPLGSSMTANWKHVYEARDFGVMPILADALQDAGVTDCTFAGAGWSIWRSGRSTVRESCSAYRSRSDEFLPDFNPNSP